MKIAAIYTEREDYDIESFVIMNNYMEYKAIFICET